LSSAGGKEGKEGTRIQGGGDGRVEKRVCNEKVNQGNAWGEKGNKPREGIGGGKVD